MKTLNPSKETVVQVICENYESCPNNNPRIFIPFSILKAIKAGEISGNQGAFFVGWSAHGIYCCDKCFFAFES